MTERQRDPIPFLIYGDGPRLPSGLARIARDLLLRLTPEAEELGIVVHQLGVDPPDGWHFQAWPFWGFQPDSRDQGREALGVIVEELQDRYAQPPIVFMIMDPSRCYDLTRPRREGEAGVADIDANFWGYFPLDSEDPHGRISGPAADAVWACTRVLGYGRYGSGVLQRTLSAKAQEEYEALRGRKGTARLAQIPAPRPVPYLPHGLDPSFHPGVPLEASGPGFAEWVAHLPSEAWVLGCVATNQARKDLSLLFASASILKQQGQAVGIWLHTDRLTNAWDIGSLALAFGLERAEVCISTAEVLLSDAQLAARYGRSDVTLGVGLGEGYGYPLVESLACGTPVVHVDFAGGAELIPHPAWKVPPAAWRLESVYAVKRPVLAPQEVAAALVAAGGWKRQDRARCEAYCSGAVSYLAWDTLWPRWRQWIRKGVEAQHGQRPA